MNDVERECALLLESMDLPNFSRTSVEEGAGQRKALPGPPRQSAWSRSRSPPSPRLAVRSDSSAPSVSPTSASNTVDALRPAERDASRRRQQEEQQAASKTIYITGLFPFTPDALIVKAFARRNHFVTSFRRPTEKVNKPKEVAFADFSSPGEARWAAIDMNQRRIGSTLIAVALARNESVTHSLPPPAYESFSRRTSYESHHSSTVGLVNTGYSQRERRRAETEEVDEFGRARRGS